MESACSDLNRGVEQLLPSGDHREPDAFDHHGHEARDHGFRRGCEEQHAHGYGQPCVLPYAHHCLYSPTVIGDMGYFYDELDKQLKCRKFVILFWHVQRIANGECSAFKSVKLMKEYLDGVEIDDLYQNLNFSSLNRYKKFLIHLICKKRYFSFVILIRYIKPILEKCLQH